MTKNRQARLSLTVEHARKLKHYSDTPVAWRDALLMCLLLNEHLPPKMINELRAAAVDIHSGLLHLTPETALKLSRETHRLLVRMHHATELRGYLVPGSEADEELHHDLQVALYNRVHLLGEEKLGISNLTPGMCLDFHDPSLPPPEIVKIPIEAPSLPALKKKDQNQLELKPEEKIGQSVLFNVTEFDSDSYRLLKAVAQALERSTDEVARALHPLWKAREAPKLDENLSERIRDLLLLLIEREELLWEAVPGIVFTRNTHPAIVTLLDRELFQLLNRKADLLEVRQEQHNDQASPSIDVRLFRESYPLVKTEL